ncbi:MAG: potassium transporter TrkG, partial [Pseudomonadota bacterium]
SGRPVPEEVISSVMAFFYLFLLTLAVVAVALSMMGYDPLTAISGAATALANVGPGLGPLIGPAGNFAALSDPAKWLLALTMLVGRLELMAVYVLFTAAFWRG